MHACMCACKHACMHACMYACKQACMYVSVCINLGRLNLQTAICSLQFAVRTATFVRPLNLRISVLFGSTVCQTTTAWCHCYAVQLQFKLQWVDALELFQCNSCVLMCTAVLLWCLLIWARVHSCYSCELMCFDVFWCGLMCADMYCSDMMCTDVVWCVLMHADVNWCVLMCTDVSWCVPMCTDVADVYW